MRFSEQWLRQWVDVQSDTDALTTQLTMLGLEVDKVEPAAPLSREVVVGYVHSCQPHPNSKKLHLCQVDIAAAEPLSIVCGAANVRQGIKVAVIKVGGELPNGLIIESAQLRGVTSQGMICSAAELGLEQDSDGILVLADDAPVGVDFRDYYQLNDQIIEIDLTPNRGDCASIQGIAREIAAINHLALTSPTMNKPTVVASVTAPAIKILAEQHCSRYVGRAIHNINSQATTPLWMSERLRRSGLRSIHPVVDVTNYVMLELGQPLHAFDAQKLVGDIEVRLANAEEKLTLLDDNTIGLTQDDLVIADQQQALALAGVMGGLESAVNDETTQIFLESAFFSPQAIAASAKRHGIQSDSSYRFERGVDYTLQQQALDYATQLLLSIVGGEAGASCEVCIEEALPPVRSILLRRQQIRRMLGVEIDDAEVVSMLSALEMTVQPQEQGWLVTPSTSRFDITIEIDLIEELVRMYGYQRLPTQWVEAELRSLPHPEHNLPSERLATLLVDRGYHEIISYSFVDPNLELCLDPDIELIKLSNPLSSELAVMRSSMLPGLISTLRYNQARQVSRIKIFEQGLIFKSHNGEWEQRPTLGGLCAGEHYSPQWGQSHRLVDFFDVKGDIEQLLSLTGRMAGMKWVPFQHPALHPGKTAKIQYQDNSVGYCGELHPRVVDELGLAVAPIVFELDLASLTTKNIPSYHVISKFPASRRDLALVADNTITAMAIEACIRRYAGKLLNIIQIFDIYQGEGIESGKKSVALGLTFCDPSRTLRDEEVNKVIDHIVDKLKCELDVTLRA